jgi:hypothetical protein
MSGTADLIIKIAGWVATPMLSFVIGLLTSKLKKNKESAEQKAQKEDLEYEALKETCKYMLKKSLRDDYEFYVEEQGWCSIEDKNEVERAYMIYSGGLHGNGQGTRYYKGIMGLPEHQSECKHSDNQ